MTVRTPAANASAAPCGPPRLPARNAPGSDPSERPVCAREGHFRGGRYGTAGRAVKGFHSSRPSEQLPAVRSVIPVSFVALGPHQPPRDPCVGAFSPHERATGDSPARPQPHSGKDMLKELHADAVPAFGHALVRDRALDPWNSVRVRIRSRTRRPGPMRTFRHRPRDSPPKPASRSAVD